MTAARLAHIWRHPIKGIGCEPLDRAELSPEGALLGDRAWALLNERAEDVDRWQPRRNFLQVAAGPKLAPVTSKAHPDGQITLRYPGKPDLLFDPADETGATTLREWVSDLWPAERPGPARLVRAPGHGMTDMEAPYVSIGNLASLAALSGRAGQALDMRRFRINLWVEGWAPWEEGDLLGRRVTVGDVVLEVAEPIGRCRAPEANPVDGRRDAPVCQLLNTHWQHEDFGVYARVIEGGAVALGAPVSEMSAK